MSQGDAFNRNEVSSVYVRPTTRYVVSLVVGLEDEEVGSAIEAVAAILHMTRGQDKNSLVWHVHDRETGTTQEVTQKLVDEDFQTSSGPA